MIEFGQMVKESREFAGISQVRAAKILGVDPAMLSRIENGKQIPRWDFVKRCIDRLEIQMEDLTERGSRYKINPKHAKAYGSVLKNFQSLPPRERKQVLGTLVQMA